MEAFKTPQRKSYTIVGLTIITVAFFIVFAIKPTISKIASIQTNTKALENLEIKIDDKLKTLDHLIAQKDSNKENLVLLDRYFPEDRDTALLVANFEKISERYSLLLTSVNFDVATERVIATQYPNLTNVGVLETKISVEGDLTSIQNFVKHLEEYPRVMYIDGFAIFPVVKGNKVENDKRAGYSASITSLIFQYSPVVNEPINE